MWEFIFQHFSFCEQLQFHAQLSSAWKKFIISGSEFSIHRPSYFILFYLFCCFTSQINSYGHGGTVSSPNHTFSWASLNKQLTSTLCTYFRLYLTTTLLERFSGREENDRRNYFMIKLHESMGPGQDRTRDPWICSQTRICCQVRYWLRYAAQYQTKLQNLTTVAN